MQLLLYHSSFVIKIILKCKLLFDDKIFENQVGWTLSIKNLILKKLRFNSIVLLEI